MHINPVMDYFEDTYIGRLQRRLQHPGANSATTYYPLYYSGYRLHPNTFHNTINKNVRAIILWQTKNGISAPDGIFLHHMVFATVGL